MVRIVAWTVLIVGLAVQVWVTADRAATYLPWDGRHPFDWDFFEILIIWPTLSVSLPCLGAWLLAEADRVRSARWWIGAILLLPLLGNLSFLTTPFAGDYFGQYTVWVLGNCLPVWPIWYLARLRPGPMAEGAGHGAAA